MAKKLDADYFIQKFAAIPEEKWTDGTLTEESKHCALGHLRVKDERRFTRSSRALTDIFISGLDLEGFYNRDIEGAMIVAHINDSGNFIGCFGGTKRIGIEGSTPKERILNALRIAKKNLEDKDNKNAKEKMKKLIKEKKIKESIISKKKKDAAIQL